LVANGKTDQAMKIIKKAARWNNKSYDSVMDSIKKKQPLMSLEINIKPPEKHEMNGTKDAHESNVTPAKETKVQKYSALTILKHKRILVMSIMLWFTWYVFHLTFF
jgi:hypothetical protein